MTTTTATPGDLVIDAYTRPHADALAAAGVKGVSAYISFNPKKNLTVEERNATWAAGLYFTPLNWESHANDALLGSEAGTAAGIHARALALSLAYPDNLPICISVDFGTTPEMYPMIDDYFRFFALEVPNPITVYGGTDVGDHLIAESLATGIWEAASTSWSHDKPDHVYMVQLYGIHTPALAQFNVDEDRVLQYFPVWYEGHLNPDTLHGGTVYNPPAELPPIVADLPCPTGGAWLLSEDGAIYAFAGAPYWGGCNDKDYWSDGNDGPRTAQYLQPATRPDGAAGYQIVATSGEVYGPVF